MAIQDEDNKLSSKPPDILEQTSVESQTPAEPATKPAEVQADIPASVSRVEKSSAESQTPTEPTTKPAEVTASIPATVSSLVHDSERRRWQLPLLISIAAALCSVAVVLIIHSRNGWSKPSQSVSGTVVDPVGGAIPLSEVVLTSAAKVQQEEHTNLDGWFEFDNVPLGAYELTISNKNFKTTDEHIKVGHGSGNTVLGSLVLHFEFRAPSGSRDGKDKDWNWRDGSGQLRSTADLNDILAYHYSWLESGAPEPANKNQDFDEVFVRKPNPWRRSPSKDLVGSSLENALLYKAVLSRAVLSNVHLNKVYLEHAVLTGADLEGADLTEIDLGSADLTNAEMNEKTIVKEGRLNDTSLIRAEMQGAHLENASLVRADMREAKMSGVHLDGATLSGADLTGADLSEAVLRNTKLGWTGTVSGAVRGATLSYVNLRRAQLAGSTWDDADVSGVIFEPDSTSLPDGNEFAKALGLENLTFKESPMALLQMRKVFADRGFDEQGREITYAIMRTRTQLFWARCTNSNESLWEERDYGTILQNCGEYFLNRVFFDLPCQFGMSPGRTLRIVGIVWILCSSLNYVFIRFSKHSGLFLIPSRMLQTNESETSADKKQARLRQIQRIGSPMSKEQQPVFARLRRRVKGKSLLSVWAALGGGLHRWLRLKCRLSRAAVFFGLLSAFNIGYREFNLGRWLPSITRREYNLKAVGWVRVVAGWQSLISVYLIAMWFLTYFGRPFD